MEPIVLMTLVSSATLVLLGHVWMVVEELYSRSK
jgi:hypothetical protein